MAAKGKIIIDQEQCKGCELCALACTPKLITTADFINGQGYHPALFKDEENKCSGCAMCAINCPDAAIGVFRELQEKEEKSRSAEIKFLKGNEALVYAAVQAGCRMFFGYPITPSSEALETAMKFLPKIGGVAVQMESEAAVGFACYGAAAAGHKVFTVTSGPGMNWLQDAIVYMATTQLPCVIINIMRGGPALGNIAPSQADYNQSVKGGGNGDYKSIVLAPSSVQELVDHTKLAFELADKYRNPVIILADGMIGQMKESVIFPEPEKELSLKEWRIGNTARRSPHMFIPFDLDPSRSEKVNLELQEKYRLIKDNEIRYEADNIDKPDILVVAFGSMGRILKTVIKKAGEKNINIGLLRPITLWPFPDKAIKELAKQIGKVLVVEMNCGQMMEDVRLAVGDAAEVHFYGRSGGIVPATEEILSVIELLVKIEVKPC